MKEKKSVKGKWYTFFLLCTLLSVINVKGVKAETSYEQELKEKVASYNTLWEQYDYLVKNDCMFIIQSGENDASVIGFNPDATDITVPETIQGRKVTNIELYDNIDGLSTNIKSIHIPSGVQWATGMNYLKNLEKITVDSANQDLFVQDGILYEKSSDVTGNYPDQLVCMPPNSKILKYTLLEGTKRIRYDAFRNCKNLKEIVLNDSLSEIGNSAFKESGIQKITLSDKLKHICSSAFAYCKELNEILIPENNVTFQNKDGVLYEFRDEQSNPELICMTTAYTKSSFTLPEMVKRVSVDAFTCNDRLEKIKVNHNRYTYERSAFASDSVQEIVLLKNAEVRSGEPFYGAVRLKKITVDKKNRNMKSMDGVLFTKNEKSLIYMPANFSKKKYTVPNRVTRIRKEAFFNQKTIKELSMSDSVQYIEELAFCKSGIEKVRVSKGLSLIGSSAFQNTKIKSIDLTTKVKRIPDSCFYGCKKLRKVILPKKLESIDSLAFALCVKLTKIEIPSTVKQIGSNHSSDYWGSKPYEVDAFYSISQDRSKVLEEIRKITIIAKKNSYAYKYAKKHKKYGFVAKKFFAKTFFAKK